MSSIRRLISSRLNAAKSTGPRTAAGKLRSSRNALRHGCRTRKFADTLLPGESQQQFDQLLQEHVSALHPHTEAEHAAIRRMVFARWRARRLQALETSMWNDVLRGQAEPDLITSYEILSKNPHWASISRNENACDLAYFRELRRFLRAEKQNRTIEPTLCILNAELPGSTIPQLWGRLLNLRRVGNPLRTLCNHVSLAPVNNRCAGCQPTPQSISAATRAKTYAALAWHYG